MPWNLDGNAGTAANNFYLGTHDRDPLVIKTNALTFGPNTTAGRAHAPEIATPYDAEAALTDLSRTGFPLVDRWLAPVLRGEVTAEEATDEFERRRRGT